MDKDKEENGPICSCGGGDNNGHAWNCPWQEDEEDRLGNNEEDDDMEKRHPGHTKEAYSAGRFLGVDFPYVPGDPFW